MKLYVIEVLMADGNWLPMFQPCPTLEAAKEKAIRKIKCIENKMRIGVYSLSEHIYDIGVQQ